MEDVQSDRRLLVMRTVTATTGRREHGCLDVVLLDGVVEQLLPVGMGKEWPHNDQAMQRSGRRLRPARGIG